MGKQTLRRPNKLGRNSPCFCGSGKKYKKCCLREWGGMRLLPVDSSRYSLEELVGFEESFRHHREEQAKRQLALQSLGIYINLINTIGFNGMRFYSEGNSVVSIRGENTTFHQIIMENLRISLGKEWWDTEITKDWEKKHYIAQCYQKLEEAIRNREIWRKESEEVGSAALNGYIKYVLNLAFDMYLLTVTDNMPPAEWMERVRSYEQFVGKRYEISVASIFARIGCRLEYLDDHRGQDRHPEFKATLTEVVQSAYVEAKTKNRAGAPNKPGEIEVTAGARLNGLINDALDKEADGLPYFIFADANIPEHLIAQGRGLHWTDRVKKNLEKDYTPTPINPSKYNMIVVTNYSYHYDREEPATSRNTVCVVSPRPLRAFPDDIPDQHILGEFGKRIVLAVEGYGFVPNL